MHNAMAQALINAGFAKQSDKRGMFKDGWNAHLSFRTHKALVDAGYTVFAGK